LEQRVSVVHRIAVPVWRFARFLNGTAVESFGRNGILRREIGESDTRETLSLHDFRLLPMGEGLVAYSLRDVWEPRSTSLTVHLLLERLSQEGEVRGLATREAATFQVPQGSRDQWIVTASPDGRMAYALMSAAGGWRLRRFALPDFEQGPG